MSSREQFEAWIAGTTNSDLHRGIMLDRHENGRYRHLATENKWEAWQEATKQSEAKCAALAAENAGLKAAFDKPQAYLSWHAIPPTWEDPLPCGEYLDVHDDAGHKNSDGTDCWPVYAKPEINTPATDAFLAEVRESAIPDEATERDLFEEWVMEKIFISKTTLEGLRTDDGYRNSTLSGRDYNGMWSQWKAIRAAQLHQETAQ